MGGTAAAALDHLVEREVKQVVLPFVTGHENLAGIAEDFLHGVQVQTLASDFRCLAVLGNQFGKAISLTLGTRHHFITIAVGIFEDTLGLTTSFRNHAVGVTFSLVAGTLLVFTGADHVVEGFLNFTRRRGALHVHLGHGDAGAVGVEEALQTLLDFARHQLTPFGQHLIHCRGTHDMAQRAFSRVLQADLRLIDVQYEVFQVADLILHGQRHFDDVLVFGEHLALLGVGTLTRHVFHVLAVERREIDVEARPHGFVVLPETQHDSLLLLVNDIDRAVEPESDEYDQADAEQAKTTALARAAAIAAAAAITAAFVSAAEQPLQAFLQLSEGFVEIRWPLAVAATAFATPGILIIRVATRLIPSHSALHLIKQRRARGAPTNATECPGRPYKGFPVLLLQSVLLDELQRLQSFATHQTIEFNARYSHREQAGTLFIMRLALHRTQFKKLGTQPGKILRQMQSADKQIITQQLGNGLLEQIQSSSITGRQPDTLRLAIGIALYLGLYPFQQIEFVIDLEDRQALGTDLAKHGHDLLDLRHAVRLVRVDDVQQQIGVARLFKRRTKSFNQLVRQMTNEAHGVGQHDRTQVIELQTAQGRIECGEQLIGRKHVRIGDRVEKRRFAGVGVTHQRHRRNIGTTPPATGLVTLAANLLEPAFDLTQAHPQQTTVGFELGFPRTAQADTPFLTLKVSPAADQTGAHVLKLGQFDLQLAFVSTRPLGENIENKAGTIKHATLENAFEVTFLTGREGVIEYHEISLFGFDLVAKLLDLARANQVFGRWTMTRHVDKRNGIGTGRNGQLLKLLRIFARLSVLTIQMNENGTFTTTVALKEQGRLLSGVTWLGVRTVSVGSAWQADRTNRYDGGNSVFVDHLADRVLQQNDELVERLDRTLQLDTVDQIDRYPDLLFTQGIQVRVL
ncbi:hypothetical protein ALQ52_04413 [Pseudomonas cannabina pv. alisalensis]|nr:hypothetical protein ALQ52_04413 [Pseudomonas cannabina pv. alisalensis]